MAAASISPPPPKSTSQPSKHLHLSAVYLFKELPPKRGKSAIISTQKIPSRTFMKIFVRGRHQGPPTQQAVTRAGWLQKRFGQNKVADAPGDRGRPFRQSVASRVAHESDMRHKGAPVDDKPGFGQSCRESGAKSVLGRRRCAASRPDNAVARPATQPVEDEAERLSANPSGDVSQRVEPRARHDADEGQRQVQRIPARTPPAAAPHCFGRNRVERTQRFRRRPEGEEDSAGSRFSHAAAG